MWRRAYELYQAVALFKSYFGGAFDEDAIRNNFVLIYELLDGTIILLGFKFGSLSRVICLIVYLFWIY